MIGKIITVLKKMDWLIIISVLVLISFGLVELYSISSGSLADDANNFSRQFIFVGFGLLLAFILVFIDYYVFFSFNNYFYLLGALLLVAVLLFGTVINSTRGWFYVWGLGIQPVELVKFILIIYLAKYFSSATLQAMPWRHLIISGLGSLILIGLVMGQPDLGSAALLFALWFMMIVFVGFSKKYLAIIVSIFLVLASVGWLFFLQDYQKERVMTFIGRGEAAPEATYNVNQAIIAVGAGGITGRGLGFGSQSQLRFLPEAKTDFMFAVISEELGFLGVFVVLFFFGLLFWRIFANLPKINNDFGIFVMLGAAGLIFIEMFINIGMNMGLLPVVGIGLPFVSYGGSSLVSHLIIIGVIQSIIVRSKLKQY